MGPYPLDHTPGRWVHSAEMKASVMNWKAVQDTNFTSEESVQLGLVLKQGSGVTWIWTKFWPYGNLDAMIPTENIIAVYFMYENVDTDFLAWLWHTFHFTSEKLDNDFLTCNMEFSIFNIWNSGPKFSSKKYGSHNISSWKSECIFISWNITSTVLMYWNLKYCSLTWNMEYFSFP